MTVLIGTVHVIVCLALIMIVLLQTGKGADMGAVFGGAGSQTLFGSTGATTFLGKLTTGAAIIFMLTSLSLAYMSKSSEKSVVSDVRTTAPQIPESIPAPGESISDIAPTTSPDATTEVVAPVEPGLATPGASAEEKSAAMPEVITDTAPEIMMDMGEAEAGR